MQTRTIRTYLLAVVFLFFHAALLPVRSYAQQNEIAQLLLNVQKLDQFKQILQQLYEGYQIISEGYDKVKNITSGNFKIHELFLDGLYAVNPSVKKYQRVADIISYQATIVKEYKAAFKEFSASGVFNQGQLTYLSDVYGRLFNTSLKNIDELLMIITAGELRMSDDERISGIDRIHSEVQQQLLFLRSFNRRQAMIALEKMRDKTEEQSIRGLHGIE